MQLTRRETLLGSLALLPQETLTSTPHDEWYLDVVSGRRRIACHLRGRGRATLRLITGIGARHLGPLDHTSDDHLLILDASEHQMEVAMPERTFFVWPDDDCRHLVTAWTLPFLGIGGFLGFYGADIEEACRSNAYFFDLPLGATRLPSAVARSRTTAVYAVFFGEVPSLQSMNDALSRLTGAVRPHADVVAASAIVEHHSPRLLLTVFNDDFGPARS